MSKPFHLAFRTEYPGRMLSLPTGLKVGLPLQGGQQTQNHFHPFMGIWDTGASNSVITENVMKRLSLKPVDMITVSGVNSKELRPVCFVNIILPNNVLITSRRVTVCNLNSPGIDLLIGMDIITLGDFCITNLNGITHFSFAIPSFPNRTDMLEKAEKVNGHKK